MQAFFAFRLGLHHSRKFDARGDIPYCIAVTTTTRASQPKGLGCSEVTNRHSGSVPRGQPAGLVCSEMTKSADGFRPHIAVYRRRQKQVSLGSKGAFFSERKPPSIPLSIPLSFSLPPSFPLFPSCFFPSFVLH